MKHRKNEGRKKEDRVEGQKKGWLGKQKEGGGCEGKRKFFPCISPWMLRASMKVLIKRIQKRGASSFCVEMWERVILGVNLRPCALRRFNLVSTFHHWAVKLHLCTSTSGEAIGSMWGRGLRGTHLSLFFFSFSPLFTSPGCIHVSPNPPGCLWQGKWSTLFIHLLGAQTKPSHCEWRG